MLSEPLFSSEAGKRPSILVIGEHKALNTFLSIALTEIAHCHVACVSSGIQALHLALADAPDLLIIDFTLQYLSGFQLYKQLHTQQVFATVPTILLNTNHDFSHRDGPCLFCLPEAFDLDELVFLVGCLLLISDRLHALG